MKYKKAKKKGGAGRNDSYFLFIPCYLAVSAPGSSHSQCHSLVQDGAAPNSHLQVELGELSLVTRLVLSLLLNSKCPVGKDSRTRELSSPFGC